MDYTVCIQGCNCLATSAYPGLELIFIVQFPDPLTASPSAFDEIHAEFDSCFEAKTRHMQRLCVFS